MSEELKAGPLKRMTEANLAALAAERFGLELDPDAMLKDEMVDLILNAQADGPRDEPAAEPVAKKMYRVVIHSSDGPDGKNDVTPQVNGKVWQIRRDEEVVVPQEVVDVLKNAVITKLEPKGVDKVTGEMRSEEYNMRRFNLSIEAA